MYRSDAVSGPQSVARLLATILLPAAREVEGVANMLIDQDYANVLSLCRKPLKRRFNCGVICLCVYHKEVLLVVWRRRDMLETGLLMSGEVLREEGFLRTPMPARSRPVTESCQLARLLAKIPKGALRTEAC
jgi:hypothetical protein